MAYPLKITKKFQFTIGMGVFSFIISSSMHRDWRCHRNPSKFFLISIDVTRFLFLLGYWMWCVCFSSNAHWPFKLIVSQSNVCFYSIDYFNLFWWTFFFPFDFLALCFFFSSLFFIWSLNVRWFRALATSAKKSTKEAIMLPQRQMEGMDQKKKWQSNCLWGRPNNRAMAKTSMAIKLMFEFVNINLWIIEIVLSATSHNIFA